MVVPVGYLAFLPLHAAITHQSAAGIDDAANHRYLLDDVVVTYAPSARALAWARETLVPVESLLAVGDPAPTAAAPLAFARTEVRSVAAHFEDAVVLTREEADRGTVEREMARHTVSHFACHAMADTRNPEQSGLLLAGDQWLTVDSMMRMSAMPRRLAALSSCESGMVGISVPDEATSLPAAMILSGYSGVVATLWAVGDRSAKELMSRFYAEWLESPGVEAMSPADALHAAQRWMKERYPDRVLAWAPFFFTGV